MADDEKKVEEATVHKLSETNGDSVRISPEVVGIIAGIAAGEIEGIGGMSVGIVGGIAEKLGRKDLAKGIKVQVEEDKVKIDLNIIVDLGVQIVEVAKKLKKEVRSTVESTTGLKVAAINVHILGVNIPKEDKEPVE